MSKRTSGQDQRVSVLGDKVGLEGSMNLSPLRDEAPPLSLGLAASECRRKFPPTQSPLCVCVCVSVSLSFARPSQ